MRTQRCGGERSELDMTGDEIVDRRRATAIGRLLELDAGDRREPLHHHMLWRSVTAAGHIALSRLLSGKSNQFGKRSNAERRMCRQNDGLAGELDDRRQFLQGIDVHLVDVRVAADV